MIYRIGDKVQPYDGRIGTVIDTEKSTDNTEFPNYQGISVKFPNGFLLVVLSEKFKAVSDRPSFNKG